MQPMIVLVTAVVRLSERVAAAFAWFSPLVARLTVGLVFFQSGWGKLHGLDSVTKYFAELGLPNPAFQALLASSAEFVCGGLLLVGFATRFAAVPLIVTMAVAIRTALWDQVDGIGSLVGLLEFSYVALLLFLATNGAGPISVDALVARWWGWPAAPLRGHAVTEPPPRRRGREPWPPVHADSARPGTPSS
jgi:putative oxidoreductase